MPLEMLDTSPAQGQMQASVFIRIQVLINNQSRGRTVNGGKRPDPWPMTYTLQQHGPVTHPGHNTIYINDLIERAKK